MRRAVSSIVNRIHSRHRYTIAPRKAKWHTERQEDDIGSDPFIIRCIHSGRGGAGLQQVEGIPH